MDIHPYIMLKNLRFCNVRIKYNLSRLYTQKVNIGIIGTDLQKKIDKMPRIRPSGQPPKVWQLIEKKDKNGKPMKFTIQEIPEDRYEDAVQHMYIHLLADEPICSCLNAKNDPLFVQDMSTIWRLMLAEGISIGAFIDNSNGEKPIIAATNVLCVEIKHQEDNLKSYQFKSEKCKNMYELASNVTKTVYERYGVDKYIDGFGLSVNSDYRGYGLSKNMLKIRNLIGSMYGVPATCGMFSSIFSQKSAASAGFEEFLTKNFADLVDEEGKEYYPGINSKAFTIMGKRLF